MAPAPYDTCDSCGKKYEFDQNNSVLVMYVKYPNCNHILATCPHCEEIIHIFLVPESLLALMDQLHLPLRLGIVPTPQLADMAGDIWAAHQGEIGDPLEDATATHKQPNEDDSLQDYHEKGTSYDLPEPARDVLMELWNWMRHFGGECGAKCLFPECSQF